MDWSKDTVVLWDIAKRYCSQRLAYLSRMSRVLIDFARAIDDVPCRVRILFIWLDRTCGDGG